MTDYLQVSTATPTRKDAIRIAASAVKAGLAAGAQVAGPVVSVFWHQGQYGEGEEWQLLLKTTKASYDDLEDHLRDAHPWENPEISAVELTGAADYLAWLDRMTRRS